MAARAALKKAEEELEGEEPMTEDPASYSELPIAEIVGITQTESSSSLELRVNIEGRDHLCALPLDAMEDFGLSGPAAADALSRIADALGQLRHPVGRLADQIEMQFGYRIVSWQAWADR